MQHNVTVIALAAPSDDTVAAVTGPDGATDTVTVEAGNVVAVVDEVGDVLGVKLDLIEVGTGIAVTPVAGDTVMVVGSAGSIPDYQVGALLTVDQDGWAHFAGAGAIAAAISSVQ
jgi:hypothetical protein